MQKRLSNQKIIKGIKIFLVIIIVIIIGWGIHLGWHSAHLIRLLMVVKDDPGSIQIDNAGDILLDAADHVGAIHQDLSYLYPITSAMSWVPGIGPYLSQVEPLGTFADGLTQGGKQVYLGIEPLLVLIESDGGQEPLLQQASHVLHEGQSHFIQADKDVNRAEQVRHLVQPDLFPEMVRPYFDKLDENFNLIVAGVKILQAAPQLLGIDKPQSYLVIAQNRDELRATGGFISGIGLVNIHEGQIVQFDLGDSYNVDDFSKSYPQPPEPMHRFMLADYWVTRDSNWSPDFPASAQQAQYLYTLSTGTQTKGVIAFNQLALRAILQVIGSIQIDDTEEIVNTENIEGYMAQAWGEGFERGTKIKDWHAHRKDFMKVLGEKILEQIMESGDQNHYAALAKQLLYLLESGHILVYFDSPIAQDALQIAGLDGGLDPGEGDFFALVDSNVGFNKVDKNIKRSVSYHADLRDPNQLASHITFSYQHMGTNTDQVCEQIISYGEGTYEDMQQRCYLDYWRVYAPGGSELIEQESLPVPGSQLLNQDGWSGLVEEYPGENDTQVFAGLLMVPPQEERQISLIIELPEFVLNQLSPERFEYKLRVHKQPGLGSLPFILKVSLPDGAKRVDQNNEWQGNGNNIWLWQDNIEKSTEITLIFDLDTNVQ